MFLGLAAPGVVVGTHWVSDGSIPWKALGVFCFLAVLCSTVMRQGQSAHR
jgi:hypothetical protein